MKGVNVDQFITAYVKRTQFLGSETGSVVPVIPNRRVKRPCSKRRPACRYRIGLPFRNRAGYADDHPFAAGSLETLG